MQNFTGLKVWGKGCGKAVEGALGSGAAVDEIELGLVGIFGVTGGDAEGHA